MKMYVYLLDLKQDEKSIEQYLQYHKNVEPAISRKSAALGVILSRVLRAGDRLVNVKLTEDFFDPERFNREMKKNQACAAWNMRMKEYQTPLPFAENGEWWMLADECVYNFNNSENII